MSAQAGAQAATEQVQAANLADGQWHRLHPATPLLRGGIAFVAILGIVIANLRERLINLFMRTPDYGNGDPIDTIYRHGLVGWVLLAIALGLIVCIGAFYLSWRMHSFRIGDDAVEVRSGMVFRTQRKARLDRIQGINIVRPLLARLFGAAKLEISVAGQDANVQLSYLSGKLADALRREILHLASGAKAPASAPGGAADWPAPAPTSRAEFSPRMLWSDDDLDAAPGASVVRIPPGRLFGSLVLSGFTVLLAALAVGVIIGASSGHPWVLVAFLPGILGAGSFYVRRFTKALRYSITGTSDGVRIGFGVLATSSETLPPGRIHAIEVSQPLLWRPAGWWQIRIDTAGQSSNKGAAGQANTTILPVGSVDDVKRVLALILPGFASLDQQELIEAGMAATSDRYITAPVKARWLRPFTWSRTGYTVQDGVVILRGGLIWRTVIVVPLARMQSVGIKQGPVRRVLGLASAQLHTVGGPVQPRLAVVDAAQASVLFAEVASGAIEWASSDTSHHWGASDQVGPA